MRLIDADALLKKEQIFQQYNSAIKDDEYIRAVTVADIEAQPSIDAVEQKHGHWIDRGKDVFVSCECSVCHKEWMRYEDDIYGENYCANCGARMDEMSE